MLYRCLCTALFFTRVCTGFSGVTVYDTANYTAAKIGETPRPIAKISNEASKE